MADSTPVRVLVAARHPIRIDDLGLERDSGIEVARRVRRLPSLSEAVEDERADVVLVDVSFPEGRAFESISDIRATSLETAIIALLHEPIDHTEVARSLAAGAAGFVGLDGEPEEFVAAVRAAAAGDAWLPEEETATVLRDVAADLDVTASERRGRLVTVIVGLIPLAGVLAAVWSLLWRRYLGHIGVRPVDLAADPASRTIDAISSLLMLLGWFGPLLYLRTWTELIVASSEGRPRLEWVGRRRGSVELAIGIAVILMGAVLAFYADLVLLAITGPVVAISILAVILGLNDSLPSWLRITLRSSRRAVIAAVTIVLVFVSALSAEVFVSGPSFSTTGVEGIAPRFLGFRAIPALVTDVDDGSERQRLHLGGNADLYVLVDPCNGDAVEMVSVGSSRIDIIDEIEC